MYVFIIPRLIERKREYGAGCDDAVSWNRRERDVLEHFAAQYRSWLRHAARRYVNREIARIADDPVAEPVRRGGGELLFSLRLLGALDLSINRKRSTEWRVVLPIETRDVCFFLFFIFLFLYWKVQWEFSRLLGVAREDREGLADNLSDTTNCSNAPPI